MCIRDRLYTQVSDLANAVEQTIEELADTLGMDKEQLTTLLQDSVKEPEEPVIVVCLLYTSRCV